MAEKKARKKKKTTTAKKVSRKATRSSGSSAKGSRKKKAVAKKAPAKKRVTKKKTTSKAARKKTQAKKTPQTKKARLKKSAVKTARDYRVFSPKEEVPVSSTELTMLMQKPDSRGKERSHRKTLIRILVTIVLLISFGFTLTWFIVRTKLESTLPQTQGKIVLDGLEKPVSIRRDSLGVPFIKAQSESDLFFAVGYTMAAERLWQMVSMKLVAQGRMSELVGKRTLNLDLFTRTLGISRYYSREYKRLPISMKKLLIRFAAGVNAYMETNPLPPEFVLSGFKPKPWQPEDSLHIFGLMNAMLSVNLPEEFAFLKIAQKTGTEKAAMLFPVYPDEPLPLAEAKKLAGIKLASGFPDSDKLMAVMENLKIGIPASNNWAFGPSRTKGGKSIIENDTHLEIGMPANWVIMNLSAPGYKAAGVMLPGTPIIALGTNGHIAWGATMVMGDTQDLYLEKIRKNDAGEWEYLYKNRWIPVYEKQETFLVKGEGEVHKTLRFTRHGPIYNDVVEEEPLTGFQPVSLKSQYAIAGRWTAADGDTSMEGFYEMGKARDLKEARKALSKVQGICLNIMYGNADHIAWQVTGRYPKRSNSMGLFPSPGWSGKYEWKGYYDFEKNPHVEDPKEGVLGTANHRTVAKDFPVRLSSSWYSPGRAWRLKEYLHSVQKADTAVVQKMQMDHVSVVGKRVRAMLLNLIPAEEMPREARSIIEKFDGSMGKDSAEAAFMGAFYHFAALEIFSDEFGGIESPGYKAMLNANRRSYGSVEDHLLVRKTSPFFDDVRTKKIETKKDILLRALRRAMAFCREEMGSDPSSWKWGSLHTYMFQHPFGKRNFVLRNYFSRGPYPANGAMHTLNVSGVSWGEDFKTRFIPAMRLIADFSKEEPATLITYTGISGNPESDHYDDMLPLWMNGKTNPLPIREDNIKKQYTEVLTLTPR